MESTSYTPAAPAGIPPAPAPTRDGRVLGRLERAGIAAVGLLLVVWAVSTLWYPFFIDQGIHAWAGSVVVSGGMPYRDALDNRGPLAFYVNALAQWLFGHNTWGIRVVDLVMLAAGSAAVYRALASWTARRVALAGALFVILWHASYTGALAQPDVWVGLLLALGVAPVLRHRPRIALGAYALAGAAVAVATLNKPFYAAFLLLPAAHLLLTSAPVRARLTALLVTGAGFVLPLAVCALWFASRNSLTHLIDAYILFNLQVYAPATSSGPVTRLTLALEFLFRTAAFVWAMPIAAVGAVSLWRTRRAAAVVLTLWLVLVVLVVMLQGRFWTYHWLPVVIPIAMLTAAGIDALRQLDGGARRSSGRIVATTVTAALLLASMELPALATLPWLRLMSGQITKEEYWDTLSGPYDGGWQSFRAEREVADYLRSATAPSDPVLIWGYAAGVYYLSERPTVGRFGINGVFLIGAQSPWQARFRAELLDAINRTPPSYIITMRPYGEPKGAERTPAIFGSFAEMSALLQSRYTFDRQIERFALYRRSTVAQGTPAALVPSYIASPTR